MAAAGVPARPRYYLILDFEATCERDDKTWLPEIIEFPAVLVDSATFEPVSEFRELVRPTELPRLTAFCTELTSITQQDVDKAEPLPWVMGHFVTWLASHGLVERPDEVLPITCGDWDLRIQLPKECKRKRLQVPAALTWWCNIKEHFALAFSRQRAPGMAGMLSALGLELIGRHHLGIDDARNIARIAAALASRPDIRLGPTGGERPVRPPPPHQGRRGQAAQAPPAAPQPQPVPPREPPSEQEKALRNLRKRLKQIEELEEQRSQGAELLPEQLEKLGRLAALREQVEAMERDARDLTASRIVPDGWED